MRIDAQSLRCDVVSGRRPMIQQSWYSFYTISTQWKNAHEPHYIFDFGIVLFNIATLAFLIVALTPIQGKLAKYGICAKLTMDRSCTEVIYVFRNVTFAKSRSV